MNPKTPELALPQSTSLASMLDAFSSAFTQEHRLLTMRWGSHVNLPQQLLLPRRLQGQEGIQTCYAFDLDCLSTSSELELKRLMGHPLEVGIQLAQGGRRVITGLVTQAQHLASDGGFTAYRLRIEPALAVLDHHIGARLWQELSIPDIVVSLLEERIRAMPTLTRCFKVRRLLRYGYPKLSTRALYRESIKAFVERSLAEAGISYVFQHEGGDSPTHTLLLFDHPLDLPQAPQPSIRFHTGFGPQKEDTLQHWEGRRSLQSGRVSLRDFDALAGGLDEAHGQANIRRGPGETGLGDALETYDPLSHVGRLLDAHTTRIAHMRVEAMESRVKQYEGESSVRALAAGTWFTLAGLPISRRGLGPEPHFTVTDLQMEVQNNLPGDLTRLIRDLDTPTAPEIPPYRNTFKAVQRDAPLRPGPCTHRERPTARGAQTALVVGPPGEEIYTDDLGRIRVQFHWQRPEEHPDTCGGCCSAWVRVALPSAGSRFGHQFVPRIGQEVLVDFLEGDMDRPIVVGVLHNGANHPPGFTGPSKLPGDRALSGIRSQELQGWRGSELLFDDTRGQLRARLASDQADSALDLGTLVQPRHLGEAAPTGEGFELKTQAWGTIRAQRGLLITTEGGRALQAPVLHSALKEGLRQSQALSDLASRHQASPMAPLDACRDLQAHLQGEVQQQAGQVPGFEEPVLALHGPAGLVFASTDQLQHIQRDQHAAIGRDASLSVGQRFAMAIREAWSVFVERAGIRLLAGKGDIRVQAHDGGLHFLARQGIRIASLGEDIHLDAGKALVLRAGGASLRLEGGNITLACPGMIHLKGAQVLQGAATQDPAVLPPLPQIAPSPEQARCGLVLDWSPLLKEEMADGQLHDTLPYQILDAQGRMLGCGSLDTQARTQPVWTQEPEKVYGMLLDGMWSLAEDGFHESPDSDGQPPPAPQPAAASPGPPSLCIRTADVLNEPIPNLTLRILGQGVQRSGTTSSEGIFSTSLPAGASFQVQVVRLDGQARTIHEAVMPDHDLSLVMRSPRILIEARTVRHEA